MYSNWVTTFVRGLETLTLIKGILKLKWTFMEKSYDQRIYDYQLYIFNAVWLLYFVMSFMGYSKQLTVPFFDEFIVLNFDITTLFNWWISFLLSMWIVFILTSLLVNILIKVNSNK